MEKFYMALLTSKREISRDKYLLKVESVVLGKIASGEKCDKSEQFPVFKTIDGKEYPMMSDYSFYESNQDMCVAYPEVLNCDTYKGNEMLCDVACKEYYDDCNDAVIDVDCGFLFSTLDFNMRHDYSMTELDEKKEEDVIPIEQYFKKDEQKEKTSTISEVSTFEDEDNSYSIYTGESAQLEMKLDEYMGEIKSYILCGSEYGMIAASKIIYTLYSFIFVGQSIEGVTFKSLSSVAKKDVILTAKKAYEKVTAKWPDINVLVNTKEKSPLKEDISLTNKGLHLNLKRRIK